MKHQNLLIKTKILFLSTFLNIFKASFPVKYNSTNNKKKKDWITHETKIFFLHTRNIYIYLQYEEQ